MTNRAIHARRRAATPQTTHYSTPPAHALVCWPFLVLMGHADGVRLEQSWPMRARHRLGGIFG